MDEQPHQTMDDQPDEDQSPERPRTMFDIDENQAEHDEMIRFARRRAAIWGLAAGGVMSLLIVVCAVLAYLLGTS